MITFIKNRILVKFFEELIFMDRMQISIIWNTSLAEIVFKNLCNASTTATALHNFCLSRFSPRFTFPRSPKAFDINLINILTSDFKGGTASQAYVIIGKQYVIEYTVFYFVALQW